LEDWLFLNLLSTQPNWSDYDDYSENTQFVAGLFDDNNAIGLPSGFLNRHIMYNGTKVSTNLTQMIRESDFQGYFELKGWYMDN